MAGINFKNMIKGKKVLLLGPAPYVLKKKWDFNSFDVVCKINRMSFMDFKENDRCDILYCNADTSEFLGEQPYDYSKISCEHFRIAYPPINHYYKRNYNKFLKQNDSNHSVFSREKYMDLLTLCENTSPNTGIIAIYDLITSHPLELHIGGITMFSGGYVEGYRGKQIDLEAARSLNQKVKNHNIYYQAKALLPLMLESGISMDKEVKEGFTSAIKEGPEWKK